MTPNVVEGDVERGGALMAGHYIGGDLDSESGARGDDDDVGQLINDTAARLPRIAYIRPSRPFGVNSASWSESQSSTL